MLQIFFQQVQTWLGSPIRNFIMPCTSHCFPRIATCLLSFAVSTRDNAIDQIRLRFLVDGAGNF
ncbi:hypothetical protein DIE14_20635 [Burkholderia sp. Bp9017]|nr:hypothetical protein DIE14_20635 [Burkholderia sp. Bp9017]RQZ32574.1 hypothetical protein DIE13_20160 [Burkholderia sp. Bp9016]